MCSWRKIFVKYIVCVPEFEKDLQADKSSPDVIELQRKGPETNKYFQIMTQLF